VGVQVRGGSCALITRLVLSCLPGSLPMWLPPAVALVPRGRTVTAMQATSGALRGPLIGSMAPGATVMTTRMGSPP
jgi:hypothetical protein